MEFLTPDVGLHYIIGLMGAAAGWYASRYCQHLWHRLVIVAVLVYVEAVVSVAVVG